MRIDGAIVVGIPVVTLAMTMTLAIFVGIPSVPLAIAWTPGSSAMETDACKMVALTISFPRSCGFL